MLSQYLPAKLFKALAEPNRISILALLAERGHSMTATELSREHHTDLSVISRHLHTLSEAGILHREKRGKEVCFNVLPGGLSSMLRQLADALDLCCPPGKELKTQGQGQGGKK
jgi:ArsR family transcriptional regulator